MGRLQLGLPLGPWVGGGLGGFLPCTIPVTGPPQQVPGKPCFEPFWELGAGVAFGGLGGVVGAGVRCGIGWVLFFIQQLDESCLRFEVKLDVRPWCR